MDPNDTGRVDWRPWSAEPFAVARAERKPVLLWIVAPWAAGCARMARETFSDPETCALIEAGAVPVRVDADHRPDLADRFDLGGLPTTALLTPDAMVIGGGTFVTPSRLRVALLRATAALRDGSLDAAGPAEGPVHAAAPSVESLERQVFGHFDDRHGGFCGAPKFPLAAPVMLAIDRAAGDTSGRLRTIAVRTLDAMGWGPLYDEDDGGFFRCALHDDWSAPQPEKLLGVNAAMLELYLHAGVGLGDERWFARAVDLVSYIETAHTAANGAWLVTPGAEPGRQFTDSNAAAAAALLLAARVFQDDRPRAARDRRSSSACCSRRTGPAKGSRTAPPGCARLLADQVAMAAAVLRAWESTGNIVYRMMAEELMHYALRTMWDETGHGFFSVTDELRSAEPAGACVKPFVLNCDAAVVLADLAAATGTAIFAERGCGDARLRRRARPRVRTARGPLPARPVGRTPVIDFRFRHDLHIAFCSSQPRDSTAHRLDPRRPPRPPAAIRRRACRRPRSSRRCSSRRCASTRRIPQHPHSDRFVLSKGHAAPILYAAWAEAGLFPREELTRLREIGSDLEGHPTPRLSFVDVATGSLGQGICAAIGTALNARRIGSDYRTYVLLGDGEMAEGSVWEAANAGLYHRLDNLCVIIDVNALGPEPAHAVRSRHAGDRGPLDARSAGTPSRSTATTCSSCSTPMTRRAAPADARR